MSRDTDPMSLRIAACPGSLGSPFVRVLARQREEQPETQPSLVMTGIADQTEGLADGRYDVGLSLEAPVNASLAAVPMWRDEVAVALPTGHPLLSSAEITVAELARHALVLWSPDRCESLAAQVNTLLHAARRPLDVEHWAVSFETLTMMVAAGYGVGLAAKSQIAESRTAGVVMRPMAGAPHYLTAYLLHPIAARKDIAARFVERAKALVRIDA